MTTIAKEEYIKRKFLDSNIRIDYKINCLRRVDEHLFAINGYNQEGNVVAYVNNHMYIQILMSDTSVRYVIYFGKTTRQPLLRADIDFEGINGPVDLKRAYVTVFNEDGLDERDLSLNGDIAYDITMLFDEVLDEYSDEVFEEYLGMLNILWPCLKSSEIALNRVSNNKGLIKKEDESR